MTYCIGLFLHEGLVMLSDTRTNAGVDNISTFRKMTVWETPGERVIALLTAGNLAVTQAVVNLLDEGIETEEEKGGGEHTLLTVPSMFQAARLVGRAVREVWRNDAEAMRAQDTAFTISMILGGQIRDRTMRLFQVYAAGNFIAATVDTPYFQIGEIKYGKPILDRAAHHGTDLVSGVKLCLISMDSTLRSNLTVGLPMDLLVYRKNALQVETQRRIEAEDPYFRDLSRRWSEALRDAYGAMPDPPWLDVGTHAKH
jgi:putative proteasome-type protease